MFMAVQKKKEEKKLAAWARRKCIRIYRSCYSKCFWSIWNDLFIIQSSLHSLTSYAMTSHHKLEIDAELKLIYIGELVSVIEKIIDKNDNDVKEKSRCTSYLRK